MWTMNKNHPYHRKLGWRHFKALYALYATGKTRQNIGKHDYIQYLIYEKKLIRPKPGNLNIWEAQRGYKDFFRGNLLDNYTRYQNFFLEEGLENDARKNYSEEDILTLIFIAEHREALKKGLTTQRTFSTNIFDGKGSKYLENHNSLKGAVCQLLSINDFPEKDPKNWQWRFVVDCPSPDRIVLCENLDHLKLPDIAKENNTELWYVGGNNIAIINDISTSKLLLPIYYSGDWDFHGLKIYSRIKHKLKEKGANLILLTPQPESLPLPVDSPHHKSKWKNNKRLSGLNPNDFTEDQIQLIEKLIKKDEWLEEERSDLIELLVFNKKLEKN